MSDPTPTRAITGRLRARMAGAGPSLLIVSPGAQRGWRLPLDQDERKVGRADGNDLILDDPTVSRHHAVFRRAGSAVLVEDAGSTAGVYVDGRRIDGPVLLHPGDVVTLGRVALELQTGEGRRGGGTPPASAPPPGPGSAGRDAPSARANYDIGWQRGESITNIGGHQYNEYALRFTPLRRRARVVIRLGVAVVFGGFALMLVGIIRYLSVFGEWMDLIFSSSEVSPEQAGEVFRRFLSNAFPYFVGGMAVMVIGIACIVTGLLMRRHAKEAAR